MTESTVRTLRILLSGQGNIHGADGGIHYWRITRVEADRLRRGQNGCSVHKHDRSQVDITFNCGQAFSPMGSATPGYHCGLHAPSQLCRVIPIASGERPTEAAGSTLDWGGGATDVGGEHLASIHRVGAPIDDVDDNSPAAKTGQASL